MAIIGKRNQLRVVRDSDHGVYLDGGEHGEILLPKRYVQPGDKPGDVLDVFSYRESEDRMVATTETPLARVGEFASLKVVGGHARIGAFLDWGLSKDLLLPNRELTHRPAIGDSIVVFVYVDKRSDRIVATTQFDGLLNLTPPKYEPKQRVSILVVAETPLGYKAIVEGAHWGLLYRTDLGVMLQVGTKMDAYVRVVRPDGKIDLSIELAHYQERVAPLTEKILEALKANGGKLPLNDRSSPGEVFTRFGTSKKAFKQALGALYKSRRIAMTEDGIELLPEPKVAVKIVKPLIPKRSSR